MICIKREKWFEWESMDHNLEVFKKNFLDFPKGIIKVKVMLTLPRTEFKKPEQSKFKINGKRVNVTRC